MERFIQEFNQLLERDAVGPVSLSFLLLAALLLVVLPAERRRVLGMVLLFLGALLLLLTSAAVTAVGLGGPSNPVYWAGLMLGGIAMVNVLACVLFDVLPGAVRWRMPHIARDILTAIGYVAVGLTLLSRGGLSLSGLVTTSAVLTAVIGFSLQDTLGNIFGGLVVQLDRSIQVGDWVKVDQNSGQVVDIRWRHTAIETRNWETVIIPNSVLMKSQVLVLGRRSGQPVQWRRWVHFNVDFRFDPGRVIAAVEEALLAEPIDHLAASPQPNCVCLDFKESYASYAVRYWLTDLAVDDPTDSVVRTRIAFALKRAGIPLSIPAASLFLTKDTEERRDHKHDEELARRLTALAGVELFHSLNPDERQLLAERLVPAPFARGEAMTRQGAQAHWLYIVTRGRAEIDVVAEGNLRKKVAVIEPGQFFGEMSLMTGAPRAATVVALEDVECYRLNKEAFMDILHRRPELVEQISRVLASRQVELDVAREGLDAEARARRLSRAHEDILTRISSFFGLGGDQQRIP